MSHMQIEHTQDGECINLISDKDINVMANNNEDITIVKNRTINVLEGTHKETIKGDTTIDITTGDFSHSVDAGTADYYVKSAVTEVFDDTQDTIVKNDISIVSTAGEILIDASKKITLHTGDSIITMESNGTITIHGKNIRIIGDVDIIASAPKIEISGGDEAKLGVDNQSIVCDKAKTTISGAAINSSAVGTHEITGALVKIN